MSDTSIICESKKKKKKSNTERVEKWLAIAGGR